MTTLLHIPTPSRCPNSATSVPDDITMVHLDPDERLHAARRVVCVAGGLLYVQAGDEDVLLMPGEQLVLSDGARAWNAGDEPAQLVLYN